MQNYNLKAKRKSDGQIVEFTAIEEAYARGQAEAYKKCVEVAKSNAHKGGVELTLLGSGYNIACEHIAQAIEELSSKIGNINKQIV